jgi:hypothetical protein
MGAVTDSLRSGSWLTRERARLWMLAVLAACLVGLAYVVATSDGLNDHRGRPLGTDFSNLYAAGTYVLEGNPAAPFDWQSQHAREQAIFGPNTPFYGWHYPPFFLFVAGALALLPYASALVVWQDITLLLYLLTVGAILRSASSLNSIARRDRLWLLAALAFPAVFINIGHGHNGFLTAALLGSGLLVLDRRPVLAGVLLGLLAYKPQFGVLIPLVLIATGRSRAFAAAAVTVALLVLATCLVFGFEVWRAFFDSAALTRTQVLEQGGTGWHKIQSVFAWVRLWGGDVSLAYGMQATATLALAAAVVWLWRRPVAYPLKAAALMLAAILATPYSLDYDLMVLAPAMAFLVAHGTARGFMPYEKSALAIVWLMPLIARTVGGYAMIPLAVPAMLVLFALILWRACGGRAILVRPAPQPH